MRKKLVAGNWKMHGSRAFTRSLLAELAAAFGDGAPCDIAVCPPYPYLPEAVGCAAGSPILVGAQDISAEDEGAFTGEVSGAMLADLGCHRSEEHTSELQSLRRISYAVFCLKKKKKNTRKKTFTRYHKKKKKKKQK